MRQRLVLGNWKMNGCQASIDTLLNEILTAPDDALIRAGIIPPSLYIPYVASKLKGSSLALGAQNIYPKDQGAFTGEISCSMLKDFNCTYVLVGHSERRQTFKEDENFVAQKFHHVKEHGMIPVLCLGETWQERENNQTQLVIANSLRAVLERHAQALDGAIVAYEPVWAIGTGKTATPDEAQEVHHFIREFVAQYDQSTAEKLTILYGGSVTAKNAHELFAMPDVDGGLIGGASLDATQFLEIIKCINFYC